MIVSTTNRMQPPAGTVLHVAGELDTFSADRLRDKLRRLGTPPGAVVVDLSGVTFMSCTALRVLAEARTRLGTRLYLSGRSRVVTRLLAMTGMATHFADLTDDDPALGQARDLLTAVHGCTDEEAGRMLTGAAEDCGVPVRELVDLLVRAPRVGDDPPSATTAVATLALLMRPPADEDTDAGDVVRPEASTSTGGQEGAARLMII
jgi:anti-sigma B factor antagonist